MLAEQQRVRQMQNISIDITQWLNCPLSPPVVHENLFPSPSNPVNTTIPLPFGSPRLSINIARPQA